MIINYSELLIMINHSESLLIIQMILKLYHDSIISFESISLTIIQNH
jgi:hypothetical protein